MDRLDDLEAFLAIVERGSQTSAARHLRRSLQSINRSLVALEQRVGVKLVQRTTRQSRPTEAGLAFYRRVKPAFEEINDAKREATDKGVEPSGLLRIGTPVSFAPAYVAPTVCDFIERYPQVEVELIASDEPVDIVREGLDLAVRVRELPDTTLRARRLGELRVVVFGAPAYFAKHGRPQHPDELTRHECIIRISDGNAETWPFRIEGRRKSVRVDGRFKTDSLAATHVAAARGLGIGRAPLWQIFPLVDGGVVEIILEDFEVAKLPIYAVLPSARIQLVTTQLFVNLLAEKIKRERW